MQNCHRFKKGINFFKDYFLQPSHPVNLAVFRIVLCYIILTEPRLHQLVWLAQLQKELIFPLPGFEWFTSYIPITESSVTITYWLLKFFCVTGILGLYSRVSMISIAILSFYILGVPNFFGKVNHNHHLVLFATVMAVSRCADVLSIDAILKSRKKPYVPKPSVIYGMPIRFIWLIFGLIYFFPGFWKLYDGGLDWVFSDNLKYQFYHLWYLKDWMPFFRIDQYPLLYKTLGLLTILFEISFVFLLFLGRLRYIAFIGGIFFHIGVSSFMRISFRALQYCYVVFFDWSFLYNWYRSRFFNERASPTYDTTDKANYSRLVVIVGTILIMGNVYAGFTNNISTWYFSCYPTFQRPRTKPEIRILTIDAKNKDGNYKRLDFHSLSIIRKKYPTTRFYSVLNKIARYKDTKRFLALWGAILKHYPDLKDIESVRIYRDYFSTIPEDRENEPIKRRLLFELDSKDLRNESE